MLKIHIEVSEQDFFFFIGSPNNRDIFFDSLIMRVSFPDYKLSLVEAPTVHPLSVLVIFSSCPYSSMLLPVLNYQSPSKKTYHLLYAQIRFTASIQCAETDPLPTAQSLRQVAHPCVPVPLDVPLVFKASPRPQIGYIIYCLIPCLHTITRLCKISGDAKLGRYKRCLPRS
jgi:hypothetical protein